MLQSKSLILTHVERITETLMHLQGVSVCVCVCCVCVLCVCVYITLKTKKQHRKSQNRPEKTKIHRQIQSRTDNNILRKSTLD